MAAYPTRPTITINNSNIANLNLGKQIGTINAALNVLSTGGDQSKEFAAALKQLTEAITASSSLDPERKTEAVDVVSTLAEQASAPQKKIGTLRALVNTLPAMITGAKDVIEIWNSVHPAIKGFLGI